MYVLLNYCLNSNSPYNNGVLILMYYKVNEKFMLAKTTHKGAASIRIYFKA